MAIFSIAFCSPEGIEFIENSFLSGAPGDAQVAPGQRSQNPPPNPPSEVSNISTVVGHRHQHLGSKDLSCEHTHMRTRM